MKKENDLFKLFIDEYLRLKKVLAVYTSFQRKGNIPEKATPLQRNEMLKYDRELKKNPRTCGISPAYACLEEILDLITKFAQNDKIPIKFKSV